jgi:hypothetical protein
MRGRLLLVKTKSAPLPESYLILSVTSECSVLTPARKSQASSAMKILRLPEKLSMTCGESGGFEQPAPPVKHQPQPSRPRLVTAPVALLLEAPPPPSATLRLVDFSTEAEPQ